MPLMLVLLICRIVHAFDITYVNPTNSPNSGGASISIAGLSFGSSDVSPTVAIWASTICTTSSWTTGTSVTCQAFSGSGLNPSGAFANDYLMDMTVASTVAVDRNQQYFSFDAPTISSALPINLPTSLGSSFTLAGSNFAMELTTPTVAIGATICLTSYWTTNTFVTCASVPSGRGAGVSTSISLSQQLGTLYVGFTYDAPSVTAFTAVNTAKTSGARFFSERA